MKTVLSYVCEQELGSTLYMLIGMKNGVSQALMRNEGQFDYLVFLVDH